jgi:hypothetical protein
MLENSINDGALYRFKTFSNSEEGFVKSITFLKTYWSAVAKVFPTAWGKKPDKSRLSHGIGIIALGYLMDSIADKYRSVEIPPEEVFFGELSVLKPFCAWTEGQWDFGNGIRKSWNDIQNLTKDIELVSNFLLVKYKSI